MRRDGARFVGGVPETRLARSLGRAMVNPGAEHEGELKSMNWTMRWL